MEKIFLIFLISFMGITSCKTTQPNNPETQLSQLKGMWIFEAKGNFRLKDQVEIKLYHEQKEPLNLQRPMEMRLEYEENGTWRTIKKLYCPCLQNCPPPPHEREIPAQESVFFNWKPEEQWCEDGMKASPAPVGKYRLVVNHRIANDKKLYFQHYEFNLKK